MKPTKPSDFRRDNPITADLIDVAEFWTVVVLVVTTVVLCTVRFSVPSRLFSTFTFAGSYEAVSHIFFGVLVGLWLAGRERKEPACRAAFWCAVAMFTVEFVMFGAQYL